MEYGEIVSQSFDGVSKREKGRTLCNSAFGRPRTLFNVLPLPLFILIYRGFSHREGI